MCPSQMDKSFVQGGSDVKKRQNSKTATDCSPHGSYWYRSWYAGNFVVSYEDMKAVALALAIEERE